MSQNRSPSCMRHMSSDVKLTFGSRAVRASTRG